MQLLLMENPRRLWRLLGAALPAWACIGALGAWWIHSRPMPDRSIPPVRAPARDRTLNESQGRPLASYQVVWSRPLRQQLIETKPKPKQPKPQERSLTWRLIGTAVEGSRSHALLKSEQGKIRYAAVGQRVGTFVVHTIEPMQVGMRRDGNTRYLGLPEALGKLVPEQARSRKAVAKLDPPRRAEQQPAETATSNPETPQSIELSNLSAQQFLDEVRLVPAMGGAEHRGFRIDSLARGGQAASAGLRAGDLIAAVDEKALKELGDLKRLVQSLKSNQNHQWKVIRGQTALLVKIKPAPGTKDNES